MSVIMTVVCFLMAILGAITGELSENAVLAFLFMIPLWWISGQLYGVAKELKEVKTGLYAKCACDLGLVDDDKIKEVRDGQERA